MLETLLGSLYGKVPTQVLYHYTSLSGLTGIVSSKVLWANEIKYLNDADELKYLGQLIRSAILQRKDDDDTTSEVLRQFSAWTKDRFDHGHLLFVCSFTENGNLLSQWRGYCPSGKGLSLGFSANRIRELAAAQSFLIGQCIYDREMQAAVASDVISAVIEFAKKQGPAPANKKHPTQNYYEVFEALELDMLRISALLKNSAFSEENEWRLVSPFHINYVEGPIKYREGPSMLVPYVDFSLTSKSADPVEFDHIYIGPTPSVNLSMSAVTMFVSKYARCRMIRNSNLPFRG